MNELKFLPDDPKLTAYALGELEGDECAAVETALRSDPAARAAVEEIRALAGRLSTALAAEEVVPPMAAMAAAPTVNGSRAHPPAARAAIIPGHDYGKLDGGRGPWGKVLRFPQVYYVVGGLAAACFAVMVVLHEPRQRPEQKYYVEMNLGPANAPVLETANETAVKTVIGGAEKKATDFTFDLSVAKVAASEAADQLRRRDPAPAPLAASGDGIVTLAPFTVSRSLSRGGAGGRLTEMDKASPGQALVARESKISERPAPPPSARLAGNTESYATAVDNDFLGAAQNPLSTFSIDADTASYTNVRRFLQNGRLPPRDAVRIEELLNYFPYRYPAPSAEKRGGGTPPTVASADAPFAASLEVADAPWAPTHRLVRVGLKGREVTTAERPAANLVFLLDVSGSMDAPNRLPLVKESMRLLVGKLRADDRVAIVTYAGNSGLALPSTAVARSSEILEALDALTPGGSTNGGMGIQLAYDIAKANFVTGGINRVILCTDGDFNVGVTSEGELVRLIEEKAKSGVFLTVLGFGMGNLKDSTLEKLAGKGNGNYGYIDSRREAEKQLVEQVNGTLVTIAKDVKIQVEFNPAKVASYRLIGYENRLLKKEDFNNDKVDAGEIGAGHTVTALYEIVPAGAAENPAAAVAPIDELRYQHFSGVSERVPAPNGATGNELLTVKIRFKKPDGLLSRKIEFPLTDSGAKFADATGDFKFAAAVAEFGMLLRESPHKGTGTIGDVIAWAAAGAAGAADDPRGYRGEFIDLARRAQTMMH